jgi:hypothetical protein
MVLGMVILFATAFEVMPAAMTGTGYPISGWSRTFIERPQAHMTSPIYDKNTWLIV